MDSTLNFFEYADITKTYYTIVEGCLVPVKVRKRIVELDEEGCTYNTSYEVEEIVKPRLGILIVSPSQMFETEAAYCGGNSIATEKEIRRLCVSELNISSITNMIYANFVVFEDNEVRHIQSIMDQIIFDYKTNEYKVIFRDEKYNSMQRFTTASDCICLNSYTIVTKDGKVIKRKSIAEQLQLNNTQLKLISQLQTLLKEIKEAGIALMQDHENGDLYAFSNKVAWECPCGDAHDVEFREWRKFSMPIDNTIGVAYDEDYPCLDYNE